MPIILIVDDSETDRHMMANLLKRGVDWLVEFANDGQSAITAIQDTSPDLVITDLVMPEVDGIELCTIGRSEFPQIPIILVTGHGSESLAVDALAAGAASYVPKTDLAKRLPQTVDQVLSLSEKNRSKERLMQFTTNTRYQFSLKNDPTLIPPLIDFVRDSLKLLGTRDEIMARHVAVAVEEALFNAMFHGNWGTGYNEVQSARQALHEEMFDDWIAEHQPDANAKSDHRVKFGMDLTRGKVQFAIRDNGSGFDTSIYERTKDPRHISEAGGRGLTLIRNFMDEVQFNDDGNEIRMSLNLVTKGQTSEPTK